MAEGIVYDFVEAENDAYSVDVPKGGIVADIERFGGKSVVWNQNRNAYIIGVSRGVTIEMNQNGTGVDIRGTLDTALEYNQFWSCCISCCNSCAVVVSLRCEDDARMMQG